MISIVEITINDKEYPNQLRDISNSPKKLYCEGNIKLLRNNIIAIIGSRKCSENGRMLARKFSKELVEQGIVTISGMAKGIDTEVHKSTIETGGKTIAVLGSGFNHIFPPENKDLYRKIIESGGLVISEYSPDTEAKSEYFLERNRIISGISIGVLVVEAMYRSGTSVTAKIAKNQNRKVFVLPHEIGDSHGIGTNKLIRKGAILVTSTKELISEYEFLEYKKVKMTKEIENEKMVKLEFKDISENKVYEAIKNGFSSIDEIAQNSKMQVQRVNQILFILEMKEYIKKTASGYKCI